MAGDDFLSALESSPEHADTLRDMCRIRAFQMAVEQFSLDKMKRMTDTDLVAAFEAADRDNSGSLDLDEVTVLIHSIDPAFPKKEIKGLLNYVDTNEDGTIDLEEFKRLFKDFGQEANQEKKVETKKKEKSKFWFQ